MSNWIHELQEASKEAETPSAWIYWAGISTISAVVSPNVFINRGGIYALSPNVFVMLIGESGLGKGFPVAISKKLVRMVDCTRVISGANTISAILKDLANTQTDEKTSVPKFKDARGFIVSGEFSTLLQEDKRALPIITELYDTHWNDDWRNSTKTSGIDHLDKPSITLFGGSTPEHFANVVPESDVRGGFVGRILTVYQEERSKINPLSDTKAENKFPFEKLAEHLHLLKLVRGAFDWDCPETRKYWDEWYDQIRTKKVHDPTGAVNRLPDNVLKVAMCLSLARNDLRLLLTKDDLEEAIAKCMELTIDSQRLTGGKGKGELGEQTHLVIQSLYRAPDNEIMKSKLLQLHYGQFDVYVLDRIISTLESAEVIQSIQIGGKVKLKMLPSAVKSLKSFLERM